MILLSEDRNIRLNSGYSIPQPNSAIEQHWLYYLNAFMSMGCFVVVLNLKAVGENVKKVLSERSSFCGLGHNVPFSYSYPRYEYSASSSAMLLRCNGRMAFGSSKYTWNISSWFRNFRTSEF